MSVSVKYANLGYSINILFKHDFTTGVIRDHDFLIDGFHSDVI